MENTSSLISESSNIPNIKRLNIDKFINPHTKDINTIRFVCISDTHNYANNLKIPEGDILIFSGDFSYTGKPKEVENFKNFLSSLPHKYKVVIAGNHELTFDKEKYRKLRNNPNMKSLLPEKFEEFITSFTEGVEGLYYLENSSINLYGYEIYGSPYTPMFFNMAFMKPDDKLGEIWEKIPENTDILITHGPPKYIGDLTNHNINAGSMTLLNEVQKRIRPKYHIFGHIHEGYGVYYDDITTYVNCAIMNVEYYPENLPIVFDLPNK